MRNRPRNVLWGPRPKLHGADVAIPIVLWEMRQGANLTQNELGRRAGLSGKAIATYECGRTIPHLASLERLCLACGKTLLWFFKRVDATELSMQPRQKQMGER